MVIKNRNIESYIRSIADKYEVITITGPRQSGKTTLARKLFPEKKYINLEHPKERTFAIEDPEAFLKQLPDGAILDEIQRAPELLSYIQVIVDESKQKSMFVLTGSHQFKLMSSINQSLAGRTSVITLLPYSIPEMQNAYVDFNSKSYEQIIFDGFYPKKHEEDIDTETFMRDYLQTYVEKDVREISELRNLQTFQKFIKLCAGRIGQILNYQSLSEDLGVAQTTIKEWIGILEASYIIHLLPPFFSNIKKQLIKSPKLYFYDTALACYLLGIEKPDQLVTHPLKGNLFENLVVTDILKQRLNQGKSHNLFFYRDGQKKEVDLLYKKAQYYVPIEIKSSHTVHKEFFKSLDYFQKICPDLVNENKVLIYAGDEEQYRTDLRVTNPKQYLNTVE